MFYDLQADVIDIGAEELCEYLYGSPDLGGRRYGVALADIRRKTDSDRLSCEVMAGGICYRLHANRTPITEEEGRIVLEQTGTVEHGADRERVSAGWRFYLRLLGFLTCVAQSLSAVELRLFLQMRRTDLTVSEATVQTVDELRLFCVGALTQIEHRSRFLRQRQTVCLPSAADACFPYPQMREGQEELIRECYRDLCAGIRLFAEAPTGIGKTVSTLYPAVRALGKGAIDRVFYLTAKASTRVEAFNACKQLYRGGAMLRCIILYAKEQLCPHAIRHTENGRLCSRENCRLAEGYYKRAEQALFFILGKRFGYTREVIMEAAEKFEVCPYALSLDLSFFCDIIICDYNYVFSPTVCLKRYFDAETGEKGRYAFLIDEAHNLADRARDMYSAKLTLSSLQKLAQLAEEVRETHLQKETEKVIVAMRSLRSLCNQEMQYGEDGTAHGFYHCSEPFPDFLQTLQTYADTLRRCMYGAADASVLDAVYAMHAQLHAFRCALAYHENSALFYVDVLGEEMTVGYYCLDPSKILDHLLAKAKSAILFSATFSPLEYYVNLLGGGAHAAQISCPSPFSSDHLCLIAADFVGTRYEEREKSYGRICAAIAAAVSAKAGNYIVYFPSYSYMEKVYTRFTQQYPKVCTVCQSHKMQIRERETFLSFFQADTGKLRIGFCVLGGMFSEGVDLPGNRLIGSLIVGTGLPGISTYRNLLCEYYNRENGEGYAYAYVCPGFANVLQAAGRVIRTEQDRGIVVLIDDRYTTERYFSLFPKHWKNLHIAGNPNSLAKIAQEFWNNGE